MQLATNQPEAASWDETLDRIRFQASAIPTDGCLDQEVTRKEGSFELEFSQKSPFFDLASQALALSREVFTAGLANVPIGGPSRLELAEASGVPEAIELTRTLLKGPRPLSIRAATERSDWYVGRPIRFEVDGLDPGWGPAVRIAIDYGDHTTDLLSAEEARKKPFIHEYRAPLADQVRVAAALAFRDGSLEPTDELMGRGSLKFDVGLSPITVAQFLTDTFVNARFTLALLISALVYFWQFQSKERAFGSRSFDYVKAFALGVTVEAAVANLPEQLGKLLLG